MFNYIKQGFGIALGLVAGFTIIGAVSGGIKIDVSKIKLNNNESK